MVATSLIPQLIHYINMLNDFLCFFIIVRDSDNRDVSSCFFDDNLLKTIWATGR